jgi:hypothetical protein
MITAGNRFRPVEPGDIVRTSGRHLGESGRRGEIVAVLGEEEDHLHYLVRWEDDHESILYPGEGTEVLPNPEAVASAD